MPKTLVQYLEEQELARQELVGGLRAEIEAECQAKKPDPVVIEKIIEKTAKDEIVKLKSEGATKEEIQAAMALLIDENYAE